MKNSTAAQAAQAEPLLQKIHLDQIDECPFNPRKRFEGLEELAASISANGILQPVLVRHSAQEGRFELVFGHRRCRAAALAGLSEVLAQVRDIGDPESLELQLQENGRRESLHPVEEAEGYRRLHEVYGLTLAQIAERMGKSESTVHRRMKLGALVPVAREAFLAGQLSLEVALLLARVPTADLQEQAAKEIISDDRYGGPLPLEVAQLRIEERYMAILEHAPFSLKDPDLVPEAGACTTCPKRTGSQPDLFGDLVKGKPNVCTDLACFNLKREVGWAKHKEEAQAKGLVVIDGKPAEKLFQSYGEHDLAYNSPYIELGAETWVDGEKKTWKALLGKHAPKPSVLALDPKGRARLLIAKSEALVALEKAGAGGKRLVEKLEDELGRGAPPATETPEAKKKREERKAEEAAEAKKLREKRQLHDATVRAALEVVFGKAAKKPSADLWLAAAMLQVDQGAGGAALDRLTGGEDLANEEIEKRLEALSLGELQAFVLEALLSDELESSFDGYSDLLKSAARFYGVDLKKLEGEQKKLLAGDQGGDK